MGLESVDRKRVTDMVGMQAPPDPESSGMERSQAIESIV